MVHCVLGPQTSGFFMWFLRQKSSATRTLRDAQISSFEKNGRKEAKMKSLCMGAIG